MYDSLVGRLTRDLGVPAGDIRADATFAEMELDSLATMELGVILEDEYGVSFDLEELKQKELTLSEFAEYFERLVEQQTQAAPA